MEQNKQVEQRPLKDYRTQSYYSETSPKKQADQMEDVASNSDDQEMVTAKDNDSEFNYSSCSPHQMEEDPE